MSQPSRFVLLWHALAMCSVVAQTMATPAAPFTPSAPKCSEGTGQLCDARTASSLLQVASNRSNSDVNASTWSRSMPPPPSWNSPNAFPCTARECSARAGRSLGLWVGGEAIPNTGNSIVGGLTGVVTSRADDAAKLLGTSSLVFNGLAGAAGPLAGFAFGFASEFLLPDPNDARLTALESTTCCLDMRLTALEARLTQQVSRLDTNIALLDKRSVVTPAVEAAGAAVDALSAVRQSITASIREVAHCSDVYSSFVPAECNCAAFSTFVGERASDLSAFTTATGMATRALMMGRSAAFTDHNLNLRPVFNDLISAFIGVLTDVMLLFSAAYTWATRECLHRFATCNSVNCCASKTDSAYCYTDTVLHFTGGRKYTRKLGRCLRVDAQCSHGAHCDNPPLFELVRFQKFVINEIFMQHARMLRGYTILANCGSDAANPTAAMSTVVCGTCYEFGMIKWVPEFLQFDWDWPPARSKLLNDIGPFNDHCAADGFEDTCNTNSIMPLCGAEVEPAKRIVSAGLVADLEASLRSLWKVANMRTLLADQRESAWTIHELSGQRLWTEEKAKQLFYNIADSHVYGEIVLKWPFGHNGQKCTASEDSCGKKFCSHEPPSTPSPTISDSHRYRFGGLQEQAEVATRINDSAAVGGV